MLCFVYFKAIVPYFSYVILCNALVNFLRSLIITNSNVIVPFICHTEVNTPRIVTHAIHMVSKSDFCMGKKPYVCMNVENLEKH